MPRDVTPLVRALEQATPGVHADVYQVLAAWNTSVETAMETGMGRANSVIQQYHEPVLDLTAVAAMDDEIDWAFLRELWDAYPTGVGDHVVSTIVVNVTSRCVVHTRFDDGVGAIPPDALSYLSATTKQDDGTDVAFESTTVGWGISHPEFDLIDRTVDRALAGAFEWVLAVLEHAVVADSDAGIDLFERLVRTPELTAPLEFLAPIDLVDGDSEPVWPTHFDPPADLEAPIELSDEQRARVVDILGDVVAPGTLRAENGAFGFDLERAATAAFDRHVPEPVPDSMLSIGTYDGDRWHLLGSVGCSDGDASRVQTVEPFFEWRYHVESGLGGSHHTLSPDKRGEIDMCRRCLNTVDAWGRARRGYLRTRQREYDGGEVLTWTPLQTDRWAHGCDICEKPAGATHTESTYGQTACPSCLRTLAESDPGRIVLSDPTPEGTLTIGEILDETVELPALPSREIREQRAREERRDHNRSRERLPLSYTSLTDTQVSVLADHGYHTVGDVLDVESDPAVLEALPDSGPGANVDLLQRWYGLDLTAFDGIGSTLARRLADEGYGTLPALDTASVDDLAQIQGMSASKADHLLATIASW